MSGSPRLDLNIYELSRRTHTSLSRVLKAEELHGANAGI